MTSLKVFAALLGSACLVLGMPVGSMTCSSDLDTILGMSGRTKNYGQTGGYQVTADKTSFLNNGEVQLTISGEDPFKGFLLYAEDKNGNRLGEFKDGDMVNRLSPLPSECQKKTVTHSSPVLKNDLKVTWVAPEINFEAEVVFKSIVYAELDFWNPTHLKLEASEAQAPVVYVDGCEDMPLADGEEWRDKGGSKYTCIKWYSRPKKCGKTGHKYAFQGLTANDACCSCGGGTTGEFALGGGIAVDPLAVAAANCEVDAFWTHSKYSDRCEDYVEGGKSHKYKCDPEARVACCSCPTQSSTTKAEANTVSQCTDSLVEGQQWHDSYGEAYDCVYYKQKKSRCEIDGDKYEWSGLTANTACCACGGGTAVTCEDKPGPDDLAWHDDGGEKYDCSYYAKGTNCKKYGHKYTDKAGTKANEACCVCGGGLNGANDFSKSGGVPKVDEGDDIEYEYVGDTEFKNKKHLQGGFLVYWNVDRTSKELTMLLLAPPESSDGWISLAFTPNGNMAGSDAVLGYLGSDGQAVVKDYYMANQSPSGFKLNERQGVVKERMFRINGRLALTFTRPWVAANGGVELKAASDYVQFLYAYGKVSAKCPPHGFCNHLPNARFRAELGLVAPPGMKTYDLNKGRLDEPCDGPAGLDCLLGFACYHDNMPDQFADNVVYYGLCKDPESLGDKTTEIVADTRNYEQTVFANDGGFENVEKIRGGYVLMWTVNKVSAAGAFGPDDVISIAVVSTRSKQQGYLGFGFSPNGEMKGSDVVLGWHDGVTNQHVGDYFLEDQVPSVNVERNKQELTSVRVIKKNGQTALTFERKLTPADSVQILEGDVHIILASGPMPDENDKQYIPYHTYRVYQTVEFIPVSLELDELNNAAEREICGGPTDVLCQSKYKCALFNDVMIGRWRERAAALSSSATTPTATARRTPATAPTAATTPAVRERTIGSSASRFRPVQPTNSTGPQTLNSLSPWTMNDNQLDGLVGSGMCVKPADAARFENYGQVSEINIESIFEPTEWDQRAQLRWGFNLWWKILPNNRIRIALLATGHRSGWLGLGFSADGMMVGSHSVIGWVDKNNPENTKVAEYYLNNKLPWEILPVAEENLPGMGATNMEVKSNGKDQIIQFERPLQPDSGNAPIDPGDMTVIFAVGTNPLPGDSYFGYHRFRDQTKVQFITENES